MGCATSLPSSFFRAGAAGLVCFDGGMKSIASLRSETLAPTLGLYSKVVIHSSIMPKHFLIVTIVGAIATISPLIGQTPPHGTLDNGIAKSEVIPSEEQQGGPQKDQLKNKESAILPSPPLPVPVFNEAYPRDRENLDIQQNVELFTGMLVVVGFLQLLTFVFQTFVFGRQARRLRETIMEMKVATEATRMAAEAAEKSADSYQTAERAWVALIQGINEPFTKSTDADTGEKNISGVAFKLEWMNFGHTPALNCSLFTEAKIVTDKEASIPIFERPQGDEISRAPIVPGVKFYSPSRYFRQHVIEDLKNRKCRLFLYGKIDYHVVYVSGTPKHTEVCFEISYAGNQNETGNIIFNYRVAGPQNSIT